MMPLLNKLLSSTKTSKKNSDCRLLVNIGIGANDRSGVYFGADQVRILLFRECEWRGRKLLFDSVSARKASVTTSINLSESNPKHSNGTCTRNGSGLVSEHEKLACDDVSLLSEMVFGTVAMTYRGPLFKVHALNAPQCIMCTKVFPAPDHSPHRPSDILSDETQGHSVILDSNSSIGSLRNTVSHISSGNCSGNSLSPDLRKNSTCSSTSSGWDIDIPLLSSSQSLESSCSSGFGSLTSLRRRWLRAVSTSLSHSELDEIFGIQAYTDNAGNDSRDIHRRHKTRLGLAVLIQLTPGYERQMEARLLEHAAQLEVMLNRLRYACIETCRGHGKSNGECKGLTLRMHKASNKCIVWLLRLLATGDNTSVPSLWHEVIMNSTTPVFHRTHSLHRNLQQMCQLLNEIDTKSTNFFLSTIVTAVLTHHLGWVQTVMSPRDRQLMENLGRRYPCNPLWAQLGDLYGALGNPPKLVHTVVTGDTEKTALINAILTFLSYFIRSAIVEKRREYRCPTQQDVQEAINVLERMKKKNNSLFKSVKTMTNTASTCEGSSGSGYDKFPSNVHREPPKSANVSKSVCADMSTLINCKAATVDASIPRLKRTSSAQKNLDTQPPNSVKYRLKCPVKVDESYDGDDITDVSLAPKLLEKDCPTSTVKVIVSETMNPEGDVGGTKKRVQRSTHVYNLEQKMELRNSDFPELMMDAKLTSLRRRTDSGFESQKLYPGGFDETEAFFARLDVPKDQQQTQVFFTLGEEDKTLDQLPGSQLYCNCQCSFAFTRVPSTSAELPEGVLRKIIQRNFPESSKSIQRPPSSALRNERFIGSCPKCNGAGYSMPQNFENSKLLLETPTNATEVLRTCGNSVGNRATRRLRSNSLEALMEASCVVELPMPRSKKPAPNTNAVKELSGFTKTLLQRRVTNIGNKSVDQSIYDSGYTSGLVIQGLTRKKRKKAKGKSDEVNGNSKYDTETVKNWLSQLREEVDINARFPVIDQPVSEALCILADLDNWQVGILSNTSSAQNPLLPVGMSRLVATMLESFAYLWTKYRSPNHVSSPRL